MRRGRWGCGGVGPLGIHVDTEDTSRTPKLVVDGAKVDFLDAELAEHGGTHNTRLDSDVEGALRDQGSVNTRGGMELLAVWVDMAIFGVDITPLLVGVGPQQWRLVGLLAGGTLVLGLSLRLLGLFILDVCLRGVRKKSSQSHQLRMAGTVAGDIGGIHAPGNNSAIVDEYASDRRLIGLQRQAGLQEGTVSISVVQGEWQKELKT